MFLVALDTRGLPASDLQEGFEELTCCREYFQEHVVDNPKTVRVHCLLADLCGLKRDLTIYFQEYVPGHCALGNKMVNEYQDIQDAWNEFFPLGENNPAATLLTFDPTTGYAQYNVKGIAYVVYDGGRYPLSKEQVWGLCEMANEAKDVYFCDHSHRGNQAKNALSRWCAQYRNRRWGPSVIYVPRKEEVEQREEKEEEPHMTHFGETCLL